MPPVREQASVLLFNIYSLMQLLFVRLQFRCEASCTKTYTDKMPVSTTPSHLIPPEHTQAYLQKPKKKQKHVQWTYFLTI